MNRERLTAFSDGVIAIIVTIMVLDLKVPHDPSLAALAETGPVFLSYVLSFIYVAIYWNNHHHFFHLVHRVDGLVLWANMHLLFWISLTPFTTAWMGENHFAALPTALYGVSLLMPALAWHGMLRSVLRLEGKDSKLAQAIGRDIKGNLTPPLYLVGVAAAFVDPRIACAFYALVAVIWLVPDRRIERAMPRG